MKFNATLKTRHSQSTILRLPRLGEVWRGRHIPDPMLQYGSPYLGMGNRPSSMIDPDGMWAFGGWFRNLFGSFGWANGTPKNDNYYTAENNWTKKEGSKYVDIGSAAQGFMNILHGSSGIYQESGRSGGGGDNSETNESTQEEQNNPIYLLDLFIAQFEKIKKEGAFLEDIKYSMVLMADLAEKLKVEISVYELEDETFFLNPFFENTIEFSVNPFDKKVDGQNGIYKDGVRIVEQFHYSPILNPKPGMVSYPGPGDFHFAHSHQVIVNHIDRNWSWKIRPTQGPVYNTSYKYLKAWPTYHY